MALQQVGIDSEIFEAYDDTAAGVGSFLNIASNGLDALRSLGAHHQVMEAGIPTPRMIMWSATGKRLGEIANGLALDDGTVSHTIQRADLFRVIRDEARSRGIKISYGKRMVALDDTGSDVTAIFEDGTQATGDILIAADGVHSRTRRLIVPNAPEPSYSGLFSFGGRVQGGNLPGHLPGGLPGEPGEYHMIFGRKAFFGYTVAASGDTWWFANLPRPAHDTQKDWTPILVKAFEDDANASALLIPRSHIDAAVPVYDLPPLPTWHRGRVTLIGDAAHATSPSAGQGASMAIEDALVLAGLLREKGDHTAAFAAFMAQRRERVERVVAYSRRISNSKAAGPVGRVVRDLMMPFFLKKTGSQESLAWMYRHHIEFQH